MSVNQVPNHFQVPDKSIFDLNGRQTYLGQTYTATSGAVTIATAATETPLMLLTNPTGTTQSLFVFLKRITVLTSGSTASYKVYLGPTVTTVGTAATRVNLRPAFGNGSIAAASYSPTISVNGTLIETMQTESGLLCILDPGQKLLITTTVSANNTSVVGQLSWNEI
jgi:hypothetical protein